MFVVKRKLCLFILIIILIILIYYLNSLYYSYSSSSSSFNDISISYNYTYIPNNWTGLPISINNELYVNPLNNIKQYNAGFYSFFKKIILMSDYQYINDDKYWDDLVSIYESIIGWNGIFDVLSYIISIGGINNTNRQHKLGELLYNHSNNCNPEYLVQITSREILHKAPMHGSIWKYIQSNNILNSQSPLSIIYNNICYFKSYQNMGNIWISCIHGIGHGLRYSNNISTAISFCNSDSNGDFKYACATGVYMEIESDINAHTFFPCDRYLFPGACYRFKNRLFNNILRNISNPCLTQYDEYHIIGCIWGKSFVQQGSPTEFIDKCNIYLPEIYNNNSIYSYRHAACIDGYLSSKPIHRIKNNIICEKLKNYPLSYDICLKRKNTNWLEFTFNIDTEYYYNYNLLEKYNNKTNYNNNTRALWLPEWNT